MFLSSEGQSYPNSFPKRGKQQQMHAGTPLSSLGKGGLGSDLSISTSSNSSGLGTTEPDSPQSFVTEGRRNMDHITQTLKQLNSHRCMYQTTQLS